MPVKEERRGGYDFTLMDLMKERWEGLLNGDISLEEEDKKNSE
jgi:hypothetical protein